MAQDSTNTQPARTDDDRCELLERIIVGLSGEDKDYWYDVYLRATEEGSRKPGRNQKIMQGIYDKYFPWLKVLVPNYSDIEDKFVLFVAQGMTCDAIYSVFDFGKFMGGETSIDRSLNPEAEKRCPRRGSYLIALEQCLSPDEKTFGQSVSKADPSGELGITLLERMLIDLVVFDATGERLDDEGVTVCSGSRFPDGTVPSMFFYRPGQDEVGVHGEARIGSEHVDTQSADYGIRAVRLVTI